MFCIEITNQQTRIQADEVQLREVVRRIVKDASYAGADISLALVDDPTIHELNRRFLDHDYATDVLSFLLEDDGQRLEGEVIVSTDTAQRAAAEWGWSAEGELLLYVIHGTLHLVGYDDTTPEASSEMRSREDEYLRGWHLTRPSHTMSQEGRS